MNHKNTQHSELRVGIAGCGHVAEHHARFLQAIPGVRLVGIADVNQEAARRFAESYGAPTVSNSVEKLLDTEQLHVLHVTTPPAFHYSAARAGLERGTHVFLEKPMAFTVAEVADLYERAAAARVQLCPDFINLFHPRMQQVLQLVESGQLGGVTHVDTELCLNLRDELRDAEGLHWSHCLPGGLLRDYTSHVLYLALYFAGWPREIHVIRKATGILPQGLTDHLLAEVEGENCTASILLSSLSKRPTYRLRLICENGSAEVDFDSQVALVRPKSAVPRKIALATGNFLSSWSLSVQAAGNIFNFVRGKLVPYAGLQVLLPRFYNSIRTGAPLPVSRELATAVTFAEESIFAGATPTLAVRGCVAASTQTTANRMERVLVTGASGYVGTKVVRALVRGGYWVRALVRPTSNVERLKQLGVEIFLGDVRSFEDVNEAAAGMDFVAHLAAGVQGSQQSIVDSCVCGARNVARAASLQRVRRVLYMSSLSVYDFTRLRDGQEITAESALESDPESRGAYSIGKRLAEDVALSQLSSQGPAWTILRPSLIVGGGRDLIAPLGTSLGNTVLCMSSRRKYLALVHVEDVAMAVVKILQNDNTSRQVYTISDPEDLTVAGYIKRLRQGRHRDLRVIYIPYAVTHGGMLLARAARKLTGFGPALTKRRLLSVYRSYRCDSAPLFHDLGWQPSGDLLNRLLEDSEEPVSANCSSHTAANESEYAETSAPH